MQITYNKIAAYLQRMGWSMKAMMEGFSLWVYSHDDEMYHISVPSSASQEHYIGQVISVLSHIEDRDERDITQQISSI